MVQETRDEMPSGTRFVSGWWILPALMLGFALLGYAIHLVVR